jgi:hypothetical protein
MTSTRQWLAAVVACAWLSGCASGAVQRGTLIGAVAGAAAGSGVGLLIADPDLLGSNKRSELQLQRGHTVVAGAIIGVVFGAIVGAMIGHGSEAALPPPPDVPPPPPPQAQVAATVHAL